MLAVIIVCNMWLQNPSTQHIHRLWWNVYACEWVSGKNVCVCVCVVFSFYQMCFVEMIIEKNNNNNKNKSNEILAEKE